MEGQLRVVGLRYKGQWADLRRDQLRTAPAEEVRGLADALADAKRRIAELEAECSRLRKDSEPPVARRWARRVHAAEPEPEPEPEIAPRFIGVAIG